VISRPFQARLATTFTSDAGVTHARRRDRIDHAGASLIPGTIPESTVAALRELLLRMLRDEPPPNMEGSPRAGDGVRGALRELCDDARPNQVQVEQLVIAIKQGWLSLHTDRPRVRSAGPDGLLNQVITLCIDEYYARADQT
jgi:hypothetical protein